VSFPPVTLARRLLRRGLPALLGALLLIAPSTAFAAYRATATSPGAGVQGAIYNSIQICLDYDFDTSANLYGCFSSRIKTGVDTYIQDGTGGMSIATGSGGVIYFVRTDTKACTGGSYGGVPGAQVTWPAGAGGGLANGKVFVTATVTANPYAHGGGRAQVYNNSTCTAKVSGNVALFNVTVAQNSAPGHNNPEGTPDVCRMPSAWNVNFEKPLPVTNGYITIPYGTKAAFNTSAITVGTASDGKPLPGTYFIQDFSKDLNIPKSVCYWNRIRQITQADAGTSIIYTVLIDPATMSGLVPGQEDENIRAGRAALKAKLDVTKPVPKYGTPVDPDGKVRGEAELCSYIENGRDMIKTTGECTDELGKQIKVLVEAEWANMPTKYAHPDPQGLERDNPGCTEKFDPTCAWNPSGPVTADTKKEDLVRLSRDGQSIVKNDPAIYPDTRYPPAMVGYGTAPAQPPAGSQPGDNSNPATPQEGDGEAGGAALEAYLKCATDLENCTGDPTADEMFEGAGIASGVREGMGDSKGVAEDLMGRAMAKGRCTTQNTTEGYCAALGALGALTGRTVDRTRDLVISRGTIRTASGRIESVTISIPAYIMNLLALIIGIGTYWVCFKITLRGHE